MKKEDLLIGLWFWRISDGYFKKINNPYLVTENSEGSITIKMFMETGDAKESVFSTENNIGVLIKQSRPCEKEEVKDFFRESLTKVEKTRNEAQLIIDKFTDNLLLVS